MAWTIEFDPRAEKELSRLDKTMQARIIRYLDERILVAPLEYGEALKGNLSGLWRYRIGDYHLVCEVREEEVIVLVLQVGHRSKIYGGIKLGREFLSAQDSKR